jgi:hypothetical protein
MPGSRAELLVGPKRAEIFAVPQQRILHLADSRAALARTQPILIIEAGFKLRVAGEIRAVKLLAAGCVGMNAAQCTRIAASSRAPVSPLLAISYYACRIFLTNRLLPSEDGTILGRTIGLTIGRSIAAASTRISTSPTTA